jgi:aryl sulfotransferase
MSMQNHMANANFEQFAKLIIAQGLPFAAPPPLPDDVNERFKLWMTQATFAWEKDGLPYWSHFHHAETFWKHRHLPNLHFVHYGDLKTDLDGEMRKIAEFLGIEIDEREWPALVKAATFAEMKSHADETAPDTNHSMWLSNKQFFNRGENNQWSGVLSEANLQLYQELSRKRYDKTLVDWLERGSRSVGDPKRL